MVSLITAWQKVHKMDDIKHRISITLPESDDKPYMVDCLCGFHDDTYIDHAMAEASAFRHMASYKGNPLRKESE